MDKYRSVPVISADDDCIYTCNYAEKLYQTWLKNKECSIRYTPRKIQVTQGPCNLYFLKTELVKKMLNGISSDMIKESQDDAYISKSLVSESIKIIPATNGMELPFYFHDMISPITKGQEKAPFYKNCFRTKK